MTTLLMGLVDAAVVLGIGLAAVTLMRRSAAALRHALLAAVMSCALAMPLFEAVLPQVPVIAWSSAGAWSSDTRLSSDVFSATPTVPTSPRRSQISWLQVFLMAWLTGSIVIGTGLIASFVRLRRLMARCDHVTGRWREMTSELARECGVERPVALLQSSQPSLLITCGLFRPAIILPAGATSWPEDRCRTVLRHELAHIRRHDATLQLVGEALRVVQWINPLVWLACRRLRQESEYACDDAVLAGGVEATDYAAHLLDVARDLSGHQPAWVSAPAIAQPSTLERRIVAMLQRHRNRAPLGRRGWAFAAVAAFGISVPLASAGFAVETEPVVMSSPAPDVPAPATAPSVPARVVPPAVRDAERGRPQVGSIAGTLIDQTGGTLPGVNVTLTSTTGRPAVTMQTDASGHFVARDLPAGEYELVATLPGFATFTNRVTLAAGQNLQGSVTLQLGTLQETITVACMGPSAAIERRLSDRPIYVTADARPLLVRVGQTPIRVGGNVRAPRKILDVRPACPAAPAAETVVRLTGRIDTNGAVYDVAPVPPSAGAAPPREFIDAATTAVMQWKFTPTLLNQQPMEITFTVQVTFTAR